ncbi:hypothetical protein CASFOL_016787 [Castilleja foliolosa]|uniref:Uncharacterized protein n=1 Tax=Castilleja foliolosa TaxID=1961234 RepID=A0ABD3D981_9LAMI
MDGFIDSQLNTVSTTKRNEKGGNSVGCCEETGKEGDVSCEGPKQAEEAWKTLRSTTNKSKNKLVAAVGQVGGDKCKSLSEEVMGLKRNLMAAEIVEQAVFARRGMGELLHDIDNVLKAADKLVDDQGLHFSPRKVTVSTSGLIPQVKHFLKESDCALGVSLNATTDEVRNWIMPINRKYKLELLLGTLREELSLKHKYKVLFEYVMLVGVNDRNLKKMAYQEKLIKKLFSSAVDNGHYKIVIIKLADELMLSQECLPILATCQHGSGSNTQHPQVAEEKLELRDGMYLLKRVYIQTALASEHMLGSRMLEVKIATPKVGSYAPLYVISALYPIRASILFLQEEMRSSSKKVTRIFVARIPPSVCEAVFRRNGLISLRSERDKLALEVQFAQEKLARFMKEFDHQVYLHV